MKEIRVVMWFGVIKEVTQGGNSSMHQVHGIESFKQMLYSWKFGIGDSHGLCQTTNDEMSALEKDLGEIAEVKTMRIRNIPIDSIMIDTGKQLHVGQGGPLKERGSPQRCSKRASCDKRFAFCHSQFGL